MTRMSALLERNEKFAADYTAVPLGPPQSGVLVVTCMEHRVDPAITLGLQMGETPVIRNTGGRVTDAVIGDIAYIGHIASQFFAGQNDSDDLFEVAIIHHTQCGTGFLADPTFRGQVAEFSGLSDEALVAYAVTDPYATVQLDVDTLLASPKLSPRISVSGHVYHIETGRVSTVVDARRP